MNEITNPTWKFKDGVYIAKTGDLRFIGPLDPWGNRFGLMGAKVERDGLDDTIAWYPTVNDSGKVVELVLVNDPT